MDNAEAQHLIRLIGLDSGQVQSVQHLGRFSFDLYRIDLADQSLIAKKPYRAPRPGEPWSIEADFYCHFREGFPVPIPLYQGYVEDTLLLEYVPHLKPFDFQAGASQKHGK